MLPFPADYSGLSHRLNSSSFHIQMTISLNDFRFHCEIKSWVLIKKNSPSAYWITKHNFGTNFRLGKQQEIAIFRQAIRQFSYPCCFMSQCEVHDRSVICQNFFVSGVKCFSVDNIENAINEPNSTTSFLTKLFRAGLES